MASEAEVKRVGMADDDGFRPKLCFPSPFYSFPFPSHQNKYKEHIREITYIDSKTSALMAWTCIRKTICDIFFAI